MAIRALLLSVVGLALAVGGYLVGRHSGAPERRDAEPTAHVKRLSSEAEAELAKLGALTQTLEASSARNTAGPASDASLDLLIARYRQLPAGGERDELLRHILLKTQLRIGETRDLKDLAFFREILKNPQSTRRERHAAMVVGHPLGRQSVPGVLAYYEEGLATNDSTVRAFATEGLAWITGPERQRAHERLRGLLADGDPQVRQMAAGTLAAIVREPKDADLLARALEAETEELAATEILDALKKLDPAGYRKRLEDASRQAKPAILPLVKRRLTAGGASEK